MDLVQSLKRQLWTMRKICGGELCIFSLYILLEVISMTRIFGWGAFLKQQAFRLTHLLPIRWLLYQVHIFLHLVTIYIFYLIWFLSHDSFMQFQIASHLVCGNIFHMQIRSTVVVSFLAWVLKSYIHDNIINSSIFSELYSFLVICYK